MKNIIVLYHGDCSDGFSGAWAAWKKFGNKANYVPLYRQLPPPRLKGKELYFIDFTYNADVMKRFLKDNKRVVVLDHHVSAREEVKISSDYRYAVDNSGAVLAWKYFHPGKSIPQLLRYVEDGDLWRHSFKETKLIYAFLDMTLQNFMAWDSLVKDLENKSKRKVYFERGKLLLAYEKRLIEKIASGAELVRFAGHKTLAVNSPTLTSELGSLFYKKLPPMAIIWSERKGNIIVSLRSNGKIDVSKIAAKYGGGGHKASAGFSFPVGKKLPWKVLEK